MKTIKLALAAIAVMQLSGCVVHVAQKRATHLEQRTIEVSSESIQTLNANLGAGDAIIVGRSDIDKVTVEADIYSDQDDIGDYQLELTTAGDTAYLNAKHYNTVGFWVGSSPRIDLTVYVPENFNLLVSDSSGDLSIMEVQGNLDIDDGSGDIEISDIGGQVDIDDNSGDIELVEVRGDTVINDGSGEIEVRDVFANLNIDDSSGDIQVENVSGVLTISDGSGDISLSNAPQLNLVETGSGDVEISNL